MATIVRCNCGAEYERTETKFLVAHTGDAVCMVCPSIKRASGLIISITGGKDLMLFEVDEAATRIRDEADQDANIIIGASFDESLEGIVRVSVVATGIDNLDPAPHVQPAERSLTELAGRLRSDSRQVAGSSVVHR